MTITIRPASASDLDMTLNLLSEAGLPTEDVSAEQLSLVAENAGQMQGVIGLESFGEIGLLRSLVVSKQARGEGIGPILVSALESNCVGNGVGELWLLTIDADAFFRKLGYSIRMRPEAPEAIQATKEFSDLCPGDAVLMSKQL